MTDKPLPDDAALDALVKGLRAVDQGSVEDCFLQSPLLVKAAEAITALRAQNAAIRTLSPDPDLVVVRREQLEDLLAGIEARKRARDTAVIGPNSAMSYDEDMRIFDRALERFVAALTLIDQPAEGDTDG